MTFYALSTAIFLIESAFKKDYKKLGISLMIVGFFCHTVAIINRWVVTGHPPALRIYENCVAAAWLIGLLFLFIQGVVRKFKVIALGLLPFMILTLFYGLLQKPQLEALTTAYQGYWVWMHIYFSFMGYGSYIIATGTSGLYLIKSRKQGEVESADLNKLSNLSLHLIIFGFIMQMGWIVTGAIWTKRAYGTFWQWAGVEIWSVISWLFYGLYLHLHYSLGWKGKKAAWLALACFVVLLISFWGIAHLASKGGVVMKLPGS
ncbi:MAG: cytochrome c biogenesis protein CcsA [Planctomycetota bacterium]